MQLSRIGCAVITAHVVAGLTPLTARAQLPLEPAKNSGQAITAAYEGWFRNADGTVSLLVGYFNRNMQQTLDIPVGPNNRVEPGGPDLGQPTHFLPRRQWGVFTIQVPADVGDGKVTWTLVANNKMTEIPMGLDPLWEVEPLRDAAQGNTPPTLRFSVDGSPQQGPPDGIDAEYTATTSAPLTLTVWATDDAVTDSNRKPLESTPVRLVWSKYRGPGEVTFHETEPAVGVEEGLATTTATFSTAGEYLLRLQANDVSRDGGGGSQCCWTNAHVRVTVQ